MPGTPEGAARARAAKAAGRLNGTSLMTPVPSVATVEEDAGALKQDLTAGSILQHTEVAAAKLVHRIVTGAVRAPMQVRGQIAVRVLEGRGQLGGKGAGNDVPETAGDLLLLRAGAAQAVDAEPADAPAAVSEAVPAPLASKE